MGLYGNRFDIWVLKSRVRLIIEKIRQLEGTCSEKYDLTLTLLE